MAPLGGHDPVGARLGAAAERLDVEPGGPALAVAEVVVGAEVEDERWSMPSRRSRASGRRQASSQEVLGDARSETSLWVLQR